MKQISEFQFNGFCEMQYPPVKDVRSHDVCADMLVIQMPTRMKEGQITIAHQ
jgi:hypothetical protein